jgi:predicted nucleic acid-binding protein
MSDPEPSPARIVADSDVLAADLLVGGDARECLDHVRRHSWLTLVASDPLLDDAEAVIERLADADLAADWRDRIEGLHDSVDQPDGDHPALASAYHGGAMHVLSFDDRLTGAKGNRMVRDRVETAIRTPHAFARLFDPEKLYPEVESGDYPGPDREPRA